MYRRVHWHINASRPAVTVQVQQSCGAAAVPHLPVAHHKVLRWPGTWTLLSAMVRAVLEVQYRLWLLR